MNASEFVPSVLLVLAVMGAASVLEAAVPLFARPVIPGRRKANLAMTAQTLVTAFLLSSAAPLAVAWVPLASPRLLAAAALPPAFEIALGVVALDFAYGYAAHRAMHVAPALWRFHRVHHGDPFVDVTTSYRTHPVEIAWRHLWLFVTAWALGVPTVALIAFRILSAVNGILEHANVRVRPDLDAALSAVWVTPSMHKVHHSRDRRETDSNYGNVLALHDRVFGTFVPTVRASSVSYGLEDTDPTEVTSFAASMAMPWRSASRPHRAPQSVSRPAVAERGMTT